MGLFYVRIVKNGTGKIGIISENLHNNSGNQRIVEKKRIFVGGFVKFDKVSQVVKIYFVIKITMKVNIRKERIILYKQKQNWNGSLKGRE